MAELVSRISGDVLEAQVESPLGCSRSNGVTDRVKINDVRVLSKRWGELREYTFEYLRRDGTTQVLSREVYDRGDSAAVLIFCRSRQTVVLTRQLRMPILVGGYDGGLVLEVPAGLVEDGQPEDAILREVTEETGLSISSLTKVLEVFQNPSVTTERVHLFLAEYEPAASRSPAGGLACDGEDIEVLQFSTRDVMEMIERGMIKDSKTIILFLFATVHGLI